MSDWEVHSEYDYRFNSLMLQAKHGGELSPTYQLRMSDILRQMPVHELQAAMKQALEPYIPEDDVDEFRKEMITSTDLKGKVVLDIGGYSGEMAKLALDSGAARAIVLDNHQYEHYGWEDKKLEGVEYVQGDFMALVASEGSDIRPGGEVFFVDEGPMQSLFTPPATSFSASRPDLIIFYNILYHLKNPWAALDHLRTLVKPDGEMLLCTLYRYHEGAWLYLYEPRECNPTDVSVYFGPSLEAIERLLTATGWLWERKAAALDRCTYRCRPNPDFEEHPWKS